MSDINILPTKNQTEQDIGIIIGSNETYYMKTSATQAYDLALKWTLDTSGENPTTFSGPLIRISTNPAFVAPSGLFVAQRHLPLVWFVPLSMLILFIACFLSVMITKRRTP